MSIYQGRVEINGSLYDGYHMTVQARDRTILQSDLKIRLRGLWNLLLPLIWIREYRDRNFSIVRIKDILENANHTQVETQ